MAESDSKSRVQIIVAVIGLVGVVAAAALSNWDKIAPRSAPPTATAPPTAPPLATHTPSSAGISQASSGENSPNIANVQGDVTIINNEGQAAANPNYLSALIGVEPFLEPLPRQLVFDGFDAPQINESNAVRRLKAVQFKFKSAPDGGAPDLQSFAHMEVYRSKEEALQRSLMGRADLAQRYPEGVSSAPAAGELFCVQGEPDFWACVGSRGYVYSEITISPAPNANLGIATGALNAMLNYADKVTRLATN